MAINVQQVEQYIRQAAQRRGIDPEYALRVARGEGLKPGVWQSNVTKNGVREPSYGPFQLLVGGGNTGFPTGLGNSFMEKTGLDPRDPANVYPGIDFALDTAAQDGWRQWYGAKASGVGRWDGIKGAKALGVSPKPPEKEIGGDSLFPRKFPGLLSALNQTPQDANNSGGLLADRSPIPEGAAGLASDEGEKEAEQRRRAFAAGFEALSRYPDAPNPNMGGMADARSTGTPLLDVLTQPSMADVFQKMRFQHPRAAGLLAGRRPGGLLG